MPLFLSSLLFFLLNSTGTFGEIGCLLMRSDPVSIQQMFSSVAPRYDLLNKLLSLGLDQRWRLVAVDAMNLKLEDRALDLCCGTGDLSLEIAHSAQPVACDFSTVMLQLARGKVGSRAQLTAGDALSLPYAEDSFDSAAMAFGIRNLTNLSVGFSEAHRVIKKGGRLVVLEFSRPANHSLRLLHSLYVKGFIPLLGRLLSPSPDAYRHLADTIVLFPEPEKIAALIRNAGFQTVKYRPLSRGVVTLYVSENQGAL